MSTEDDLKEIKKSLHRIAYGGPSIGNLWLIVAEVIVFNLCLVFMTVEHAKVSFGLTFALVYGVSAVLLLLSRLNLIPLFICYTYVSLCWSVIPYGGFMDARLPAIAWISAAAVFVFSMWIHIFYVTEDAFNGKKKSKRIS
ncbi:hypothetical protein J1781_11540 [Rahnella sp. C60]|uniref:hypothetical protein n=1 Tax=Rahnella TaxID=34037 RepID=UPI000E6C6990|nr:MULTISPECIES: hypothetical protein [Rahnella]MBU9815484.1 hypothetical protein [Rahnella perminowiae]TBX35853.1 hypothetical protein EYY67_06935 [Rahnella victoriana]UJD88852.1 hypothetical protein FS594_08640 [Rahnella aquatilis]